MECVNNRPSENDVIDLVGKDNDTALTSADVKVVAPVVTTEHERNTSAIVEALPAFTHGGQVQVFYDRWDLERLFNTDTLYIGTVDPASPADVICAVNAEYGTKLPIDEMVVTKIDDNSALISAVEGSASYLGDITVMVTTVRVPLNERLTFTDLNGFVYPADRVPTLDKPHFTRNVPSAWYKLIGVAGPDNGFGYDRWDNGEITLESRTAWHQYGIDAPDALQGTNLFNPDGSRNAYSWRNAAGTNASQFWIAGLALKMGNFDMITVMNQYKLTLKSRSRANAQAAWTDTIEFEFRRGGATSNWWWVRPSDSLQINAGYQGGRIDDHMVIGGYGDRNGRSWFAPGLASDTNNLPYGEVEYILTLARRDGRGVPLVMKQHLQAVVLPPVDNPEYTV